MTKVRNSERMLTSKITSKGQTTIPAAIQRQLGVKTGDRLQYFIEPDGRVTLLPKTLSIKALEGALPPAERRISLEEMDQAVAEGAQARYNA
jgi:AbrB family looped-hinge helix DNA binding protein